MGTRRIALCGGPIILLLSGEMLAQSTQHLDATEVFKKCSTAVVTVSTSSGFGSGVVVDSVGVIVTNLHVIQGAAKVQIRFSSGDIYDDVAVVDFDARRDLVLLRIKGFKLPAAELADSNDLSVGSAVFAIGAPRGLELTMSQGIVSGLRDSGDGYRVVQTTAAISPGSSGGGLFDDRGRLIAITSFKIKGGENLNFGLPINYIRGMLSTTGTISLQELAAKVDQNAKQLAALSGGSSADSPIPILAKTYVAGDGTLLLIEQNGQLVTVTYSDAKGQVFDHGDLTWDSARKGFIGDGTKSVPCGKYDTRIWAAPRQIEIYAFNAGVIKHRAQNVIRVNCSQLRITQFSWVETLWHVPIK